MFVYRRRLSLGWSLVVLVVVFFVIALVQTGGNQSRLNKDQEQQEERLQLVREKAGLVENLQIDSHVDGPGWYRGKTADGRTFQVWVDSKNGLTMADESTMLTPNAAQAKAAEKGWVRLKWDEARITTAKQTWEFTGARPEWEGARAYLSVNAVTGEVKYAPPSYPVIETKEWQESWTKAALAASPIRKVERIETSQWRVTYFLIGPDSEGRQVQAWMKLKPPAGANPADQVYPDTKYQAPVPEILGWVYLDQGISRAKAVELVDAAGLMPWGQPILDWLPQPLWWFTAETKEGETVNVKVDWKSGQVTPVPIPKSN